MTANPRHVMVLNSGDIISLPQVVDVVGCEQYRLALQSGRWISQYSSSRFSARLQRLETQTGSSAANG